MCAPCAQLFCSVSRGIKVLLASESLSAHWHCCHRQTLDLVIVTHTPHQTAAHKKAPALFSPLPVFQEKEEENQKSPCAIFIWQEQKKKKKKHKEYGEYVLMPQIHAGGGAALSAAAPRKTSKAHLHARVVRHLYCILTFTK